MVLAFHHPGLVAQAAAATAAVEADMREEWTTQPTPHLPFVPCRLQPRDVILQARQRVVDDGAGGSRLEHYSKPRVTTNASYGGADGVNAGVAPEERTVVLPKVQQLARALALIDEAGARREAGEARTRALAWVADAESAYRFCPVQRADWWT
eukprot:4443946-Pleurochrysis_carterae.AAC.1